MDNVQPFMAGSAELELKSEVMVDGFVHRTNCVTGHVFGLMMSVLVRPFTTQVFCTKMRKRKIVNNPFVRVRVRVKKATSNSFPFLALLLSTSRQDYDCSVSRLTGPVKELEHSNE